MMLDDVELEQEAREAIERLQERDLVQIDQAILSALGREWKKIGFITAGVMIAAPDEYEDLPEAFYVSRISELMQAGRVEVKGDLEALKTSDIRLAD